jgi:hypothetical protein
VAWHLRMPACLANFPQKKETPPNKPAGFLLCLADVERLLDLRNHFGCGWPRADYLLELLQVVLVVEVV